jgi:hypothetical protein
MLYWMVGTIGVVRMRDILIANGGRSALPCALTGKGSRPGQRIVASQATALVWRCSVDSHGRKLHPASNRPRRLTLSS